MVRSRLTRLLQRIGGAWRGRLVLRTVLTTLGLSLVVVGIVATALLGRVSAGLLEAKQQRSLTEATADWGQALELLAAADAGAAAESPQRIVEGVVSVLARNAGSPARYEILLLQQPGAAVSGPERATNLISPLSVPPALAAAVAGQDSQQWTNTNAVFLDGADGPAMVTGAPVDVPGAGEYALYNVFSYAEEERIIGLVRSATLVAGLILAGLLAAIVWLVTRQVAVPIRQAAGVAEQIAQGDLDQRIPVTGWDETARLAESFNRMAFVLQEQILELEDLSRVQQRFVSDVSHELRTPLTTIRMASDVLHDRRNLVDGDTRRSIELLATQVDRFEALLADLLEISRIDAGAAEVDVEEFDLGALVAAMTASLGPLARERGCELESLLPHEAQVLADRPRVARIVRNLLTNALEYGAGRPVRVVVATDGHAAAVGVRDGGPGLSEADLRRVFDRFWRADPSRARTLGGSGLGLAIAHEDSSLLHGCLEVAATPGRGALFVLTLPVGEALSAPSTRPVPVDLATFDTGDWRGEA